MLKAFRVSAVCIVGVDRGLKRIIKLAHSTPTHFFYSMLAMSALCKFFGRCIPHHDGSTRSIHDESTPSLPPVPSVVEFRPSNMEYHAWPTECVSLLSGRHPAEVYSQRRFRLRNLHVRNLRVDELVPQARTLAHEAPNSENQKRQTKVTRLQVASDKSKEIVSVSCPSVALAAQRVAQHATIPNVAAFLVVLSYLWFYFPLRIAW